MSPELKSLGIDRMTVDERISLVTEIWDSIAEEPHPPLLTEAQAQELDRRIADHEAHPNDGIPWEEIEAEALARFKQ